VDIERSGKKHVLARRNEKAAVRKALLADIIRTFNRTDRTRSPRCHNRSRPTIEKRKRAAYDFRAVTTTEGGLRITTMARDRGARPVPQWRNATSSRRLLCRGGHYLNSDSGAFSRLQPI
jgi:hypothetical protein